jgi:hypothetical protein
MVFDFSSYKDVFFRHAKLQKLNLRTQTEFRHAEPCAELVSVLFRYLPSIKEQSFVKLPFFSFVLLQD